MVERRRGELNLSPFLQTPVERNELAEDLALRRQDGLFVGFGELPTFGDEVAQRGKTGHRAVPEPCEVVPHLKIQQVLHGESAGNRRQIVLARMGASLDQKPIVPVMRT